jgi:hypothetical protein
LQESRLGVNGRGGAAPRQRFCNTDIGLIDANRQRPARSAQM